MLIAIWIGAYQILRRVKWISASLEQKKNIASWAMFFRFGVLRGIKCEWGSLDLQKKPIYEEDLTKARHC